MPLTYTEPKFVASPNIREPRIFLVNMAQGAAFRRSDLVVLSTTGTITTPPGASSGSTYGTTTAGPAASAVTIVNHATSGAPAATYYIVVTYTLTSNESAPSQMFIQNCPPGYTPGITVSSTGEPAGTTNFAAYVGLLPNYLSLQQATKTTTATGSQFNVAYPLTNSQGANEGATNLSSGILGIAAHASNETYFDGYGGSFTAGNPGSRLGSTNTIAPLTPTEAPLAYVIGLGGGQLYEFNLNTASGAFSPYLIGTTAGMTLDSTTGWWTVDTSQSNKIVTIVDARPGVYIGPTAQSSSDNLGTRVIVEFSSSALALS